MGLDEHRNFTLGNNNPSQAPSTTRIGRADPNVAWRRHNRGLTGVDAEKQEGVGVNTWR
jgi:hypothetical protein